MYIVFSILVSNKTKIGYRGWNRHFACLGIPQCDYILRYLAKKVWGRIPVLNVSAKPLESVC